MRATAYYLASSVLANALPLVSMPFLTRKLTTAEYGLVALGQIAGLLGFALVNWGLTTAYERNYFKYREQRDHSRSLYWSCSILMWSLGILTVAIGGMAHPGFERWLYHASAPVWLTVFAIFAAIVRGINQLGYTYLRNSEQPRSFAAISIFEGLSVFALTLLFVVVIERGYVGVLEAQALGTLMTAVWLNLRVARELRPSWSWPILRESLRLGYPLTFRTFIGLMNNQFDKYMLGLLSALGQVGIYSLGQRVAQVVFFLMNSFDYVFIPPVYRMMFAAKEGASGSEAKKIATEIGDYLLPFFYLACLASLGLSLFSEEVLLRFSQANYHGAIEISTVLALFYVSLFFGKVNGRQVIFAQKSSWTLALSILTVAISIGYYIPAISWFGAKGAAWATLLAGWTYGAISHWAAQKCFQIEWRYRRYLSIYAFVFAAALLQLILRHNGVPLAPRFVLKVVMVAAYLLFGLRRGYWSTEWLRSALSRRKVPAVN